MRCPIRKFYHLIFDGGTVAGPRALNLTAIKRRLTQVITNHFMRACIGMSDVARNQFLRYFLCAKTKGNNLGIRVLPFENGPVDSASIEPRCGTRF